MSNAGIICKQIIAAFATKTSNLSKAHESSYSSVTATGAIVYSMQ